MILCERVAANNLNFSMKKFITAFILFSSLPANAHHRANFYISDSIYSSHKGYAYEEKCFRFEYREDYIPGNSISPGYVRSYKEKVSVPCINKTRALNHYPKMGHPKLKYINYKANKKCSGSTTLGGLIGGGVAASLSKKDAYSWSIPLGAVLGAGIGNARC